jgi:hypothetical protein
MARSAVPVDRAHAAAQRRPAEVEGESSVPTMISSAVMACSFSMLGRLSVSSPFGVLRRAVGRQAGGTLYPQADATPLIMRERARSPMAAQPAIGRTRLWAALACQSRKIRRRSLEQATIPVADGRWHPTLSRGLDQPCRAAAVEERPLLRLPSAAAAGGRTCGAGATRDGSPGRSACW